MNGAKLFSLGLATEIIHLDLLDSAGEIYKGLWLFLEEMGTNQSVFY